MVDLFSIFGIVLGLIAIIGGNLFEGGSMLALFNLPAAFIVVGGTVAAAALQTPMGNLKRSADMFLWVFVPPVVQFDKGIQKIIRWANAARKDGLLGLETMAEKEDDQFAQKGLQLLVDGSEPETIRNMMEVELIVKEQRDMEAARLYESMGGYAPTIGILGAVMGLIHVMGNLANPKELGAGIAVAFVATIYGVAFANLFLLPIAGKIKSAIREQSNYRELLIEGIIAIAEGENPRAIQIKLNGFLR